MKNILFALLATLAMNHVSAVCSTIVKGSNVTEQRRAPNTCGDPSAALTYFECFNHGINKHQLNLQVHIAAADSEGNIWQIDAPSFRAWPFSGQPSTVPFYGLTNPSNQDSLYRVSTNGSPPTVSGFQTGGIVGYVYPTQVCNSIPLYEAVLPSSDHWYTTNLVELNALIGIGVGWTNGGIVAYVMPFNDCACSS